MAMNASQLLTFKSAIAAETDSFFVTLRNGGETGQMAAWYSDFPPVDYPVWDISTPIDRVYDSISWDKYTPSDVPDGTALFTNRLLIIQTKQMNLQNMLQGRSYVDASKMNIRMGLRDAVIALPAGASGVNVSAAGSSGVTILTALTRKANRLEKLFATGSAITGTVTASLLVVTGSCSNDDIVNALRAV